MMVALNLMKGLDKIGIPYRFNNYRYIKDHPEEIACIIGKPQVLLEKKWGNPIIFGAGIFSHPIDYPDLLKNHPNVKRILVPGDWMAKMFEPFYGDKVLAWPTGIDTDEWQPLNNQKEFDFLIYDKVRWEYEKYTHELIDPIKETLNRHNFSHHQIRYGQYGHAELKDKLSKSKAVIFLCEHETQGFAYQQILATNTPILAWERGGYWRDPAYYPTIVKYHPVSAVPYWDDKCGLRFSDVAGFEEKLTEFLDRLGYFRPRKFIMENLTLELCAQRYIDIYNQVTNK
jgi:hypothetical protein